MWDEPKSLEDIMEDCRTHANAQYDAVDIRARLFKAFRNKNHDQI